MKQGVLVSGVAYYMQVWVIDKSGPVFLAMTMPITLLVTIILSLFLVEAVTRGRCVFVPLHISILPSFSCNEKMIYNLLTRKLTCSLQYLRWSSHGWWSLLCSLGKEVWASRCQQATNGACYSRGNTSLDETSHYGCKPELNDRLYYLHSQIFFDD